MNTQSVLTFYDEHPINEHEILSKLSQAGKDLDNLVPEDLLPYDQDHYGGLEATDALVARLALEPSSHVLDICSGMGGPSRYIAQRHQCRVTGVDLTESRVKGAIQLTERVGLSDRVTFVQGDATALQFPEGTFDAALGQEAFLHIPDKPALLENAYRVLKPGGRFAFTDWMAKDGLTREDRDRLREGISALDIADEASYRSYLARAGFVDIECEDISDWWSVILKERLEMFRSLESETVRRFGQARHDAYIGAYVFFVEVMDNVRLGGGRFSAVKATVENT